MKTHEELRNLLERLNKMERGEGACLVTEVLIYLMDHIQTEHSKQEDLRDYLYQFALMLNNYRRFENDEDIYHLIDEFIKKNESKL